MPCALPSAYSSQAAWQIVRQLADSFPAPCPRRLSPPTTAFAGAAFVLRHRLQWADAAHRGIGAECLPTQGQTPAQREHQPLACFCPAGCASLLAASIRVGLSGINPASGALRIERPVPRNPADSARATIQQSPSADAGSRAAPA